jgi:hypothetical protein
MEKQISHDIVHRRQAVYWRLLSAAFDLAEQGANFDSLAADIAADVDLPELVLDPRIAIDTLLQRYPELEREFQQPLLRPETGAAGSSDDDAGLRRALIASKLLLSAFGPQTGSGVVSAEQYGQWTRDVAHLEKACGAAPGALHGQRGPNGGSETEAQVRAGLSGLEADLIKRMALREVLQDHKLAGQLAPSMPLVEQLLRDKANLSGTALNNAKRLIREYVGQLTEVLRLQVQQTPAGRLDYSVPPKRVFRNLDLKRTLWKNLPNWDPRARRLYVDRLYFRHTARTKTPTRLIVVVDQSGSMVDAMVQCTILASIFAGLPNVDVHLLAFDVAVLDLTPWVHDPFEVLLRTNLGGGTHIYNALVEASRKLAAPRNTALVLISDFYEGGSQQVLLDYIKSLLDSGVSFIPVGSVNSSGYFRVNDWFRSRLKDLGAPILTGSPQKLIQELKKLIVV